MRNTIILCLLLIIIIVFHLHRLFKKVSTFTELPKKRSIGRPPKVKSTSTTPGNEQEDVLVDDGGADYDYDLDDLNDFVDDDLDDFVDINEVFAPKKKRGYYRSYSLQFKTSIVLELTHTPVGELSERYGISRSTIFSWEKQLRMKNKKIAGSSRGHLCHGSGRKLSYPKEIDEEIAEWILTRRDVHLPVSGELVKAKAKLLVKPYNDQFRASKGWLEKFFIRHGLTLRSRTSISQKLPAQLENKLESFLNEVRILRTCHSYSPDMIINMDETPMYFDMLPEHTVSKKGVKEVRVRSSGAEKKRLTVVLTCAGDGLTFPALAIFKGKRKLKFRCPEDVHVTVQQKGWMDSELMLRWFKAVILPYTKAKQKRALLIIDSFSAHESSEFLSLAKANNVDISIIPGGCTSKVQPLDVCINKPFKSVLRRHWTEHIDTMVATNPNLTKLTTASKETICHWIKAGLDYLKQNNAIVKKSFLVCGITNALDGSENSMIHCAKELPNIQLPYVDESIDDIFQSGASDSGEDSSVDSDIADSD